MIQCRNGESDNKELWIRASLFCSRGHITVVIRNGIKPFLEQLAAKMQLDTFRIVFVPEKGFHIDLAVFAPLERAMVTARMMDIYFKHFFNTAGFDAGLRDQEGETFFMPPPENTIQYGLYNLLKPHIDLRRLVTGLSRIVMEHYDIVCNGTGDWYSYAFYIHLAAIQIFNERSDGLIRIMGDWLSNSPFHHYQAVDIGEENRLMAIEWGNYLLDGHTVLPEEGMESMVNGRQELRDGLSGMSIDRIPDVFHIINEGLCLGYEDIVLLCCMINAMRSHICDFVSSS